MRKGNAKSFTEKLEVQQNVSYGRWLIWSVIKYESFDPKYQYIFLVEFPKIEKLLKNFNAKFSICAGKLCVGDLSVLAIKLLSKYLKNEKDFDDLAPTAVLIFNSLMDNEQISAYIESQKSIPYCAL